MIASAVNCAHGALNSNCGNLPHTGVNLIWVIPPALILIALGIVLHRMSSE